jgi:putative ABC transport system substrate-binding protein
MKPTISRTNARVPLNPMPHPMQMRRRELLGVLAGAAGWPLAARAQQPALPVVGYLSSRSPDESAHIIAAFHRGLNEAGFVDGQNVTVVARYAEGEFDRLPALAAELVSRHINVLVATGGTVSAVKAKAVLPPTTPMVFAIGGDPVKLGLVASLNRPGANITGITFLVNGLAPKSVEVLHELVPNATVIGFLINPQDPNAEPDATEARAAADKLGLKLVVANASTESEIDSAFTSLGEKRLEGLIVDTEPFFAGQRAKIVALAASHGLPTVYQLREFVAAGGLISYGTSLIAANRELGLYTGRVLKGTKPADLPVLQSTRFELVINLKAAKALGLGIPPILLARADEVIE